MLRRTAPLAAPIAVAAAVLTLAGCAGSDSSDNTEGKSPDEVMTLAKQALDDTSGVEVSLKASDDPGVDYLSAASGTIVADPPAFEGKASGTISGLSVDDVPVISVDGTLWVDHPLLGGWSDRFQPDDLCAPDPATLLDPDSGVSSVLTSAEGLEKGDSERGGEDNKEILTPYTGTVPGDAIRTILPCAEGDSFDARFDVDGDGKLQSADLTGTFFPGSDPITYTITVDEYDVTKDISAPK